MNIQESPNPNLHCLTLTGSEKGIKSWCAKKLNLGTVKKIRFRCSYDDTNGHISLGKRLEKKSLDLCLK